MSRIRTRLKGGAGGSAKVWVFGDQVVDSQNPEGAFSRDRCEDVFGARNSAFSVDKYSAEGASYSVEYKDPIWRYELKGWVPQGFQNLGMYPQHLSDGSMPSMPYLAVQLLAATNPSRPVMDLPVSLLELRELPQLVQSLGNNLIKRWAKGTLMREFGWTPLASDFNALMGFAKSTSNRMELLTKLSKGPMTRKVGLYSHSIIGPRSIVEVNSSPPSMGVTVSRQSVTTINAWGYVTWSPITSEFEKIQKYDPGFKFLSRKIVLGATVDASTLWNALPWSWLADWFGNIGDYLQANRNLVPVVPDTPAICVKTQTVTTTAIDSARFAKQGELPSKFVRVTKERHKASGSMPSAHLPLLTQRQVNILASLAVLRLR